VTCPVEVSSVSHSLVCFLAMAFYELTPSLLGLADPLLIFLLVAMGQGLKRISCHLECPLL